MHPGGAASAPEPVLQPEESKQALVVEDGDAAGESLTQSPPVQRRPYMPRIVDPDARWCDLADGTSIDDRSPVGASKHTRGGIFLRDLAHRLCEVIGWRDARFSTDWSVLSGWLDDGIEPESMLSTIGGWRERKPYESVGSL